MNNTPLEDFLTGKAKHKAQQRKANRSQIISSLSYDEQAAMIRYGIATDADWLALPREERARKVAFLIADNLISAIHSYEQVHNK